MTRTSSLPQTSRADKATVAPVTQPTNRWIIGPWQDLLLFLGTPLLLIAAFGFAERYWSLAAVGVFSTVLAMGHYLPGLMRAYGDAALFRRFRWRFVIAPIFFITTAVIMTRAESQAFLLVVVLWGSWHWLMQTYGLVRIYDAKVKNFDAASARLDYALCLTWFGVLYWRTDGATGALLHYYRAGGTFSPAALRAVGWLWVAITGIVSVLYVVHMLRRTRAGHPPSVIKLLLLGVSFFYYLYAFGYSPSKLIAFGLFEGYHDIQYLAIVWIFNCNRAAKDPTAGAFTRFLFRQRAPLIILYVALCVAFGSYDFVARSLEQPWLSQAALAIITGLALTHFYFDGFIWRIREPETRATLDVDNGAVRRVSATLSPGLRHGLVWALLLIPLLALAAWERSGGAQSDADACRKVLQVRPNSHKAHYLLASVLTNAQDHDEALAHVSTARSLRPGYDLYEMLYADLLLGQSNLSPQQLRDIVGCYERAEHTRSNVPNLHRNWGRALQRLGDWPAAAAHYQVALILDPNQVDTYYDLAVVLARQQDFAAAVVACEQAVARDANHADAEALLGSLLMAVGVPRRARAHFRQAVRLRPNQKRLRLQLALALANQPGAPPADLSEAASIADSLHESDDLDADLLCQLASVYVACGRYQTAAEVTRDAAERYRDAGQVAQANDLLQLARTYVQRQP